MQTQPLLVSSWIRRDPEGLAPGWAPSESTMPSSQHCIYLSTETTFFLDFLSSVGLLLFGLEPQEFVLLFPFLVISIEGILDLPTMSFINGVDGYT